jgi:hypothetical protein
MYWQFGRSISLNLVQLANAELNNPMQFGALIDIKLHADITAQDPIPLQLGRFNILI